MVDADHTYHATAVSHLGKGILLTGPSGSGKSGLALQLIAMGAKLIADDRVQMRRDGAAVHLRCPLTIEGLIEARGIGILNAPHHQDVPLAIVVDMGETEKDRLPDPRTATYLGVDFPLLLRSDAPHFAAGLLHLIAHGRSTR